MRAPNSTPTVSSSSSANRRCTLVAASARATSSSPLRPPIEGVRFSSRTRIRPAHPATVSSPPPSLSTELKTHQLFLPCLGDTTGESRNTLVNTRGGVTVVSRLRAPGGEAGRSECRSSFLPSDLAKERASGDAADSCRPARLPVFLRGSVFPCPLILCDDGCVLSSSGRRLAQAALSFVFAINGVVQEARGMLVGSTTWDAGPSMERCHH